GGRRAGAQEADGWRFARLRPRHERPRGRRPAEQRDELAPADHSITSSATASSLSGIARPRALAILRLIKSRNLVGCSTGRRAGFAPFRILSTKVAQRRKISGRLAA